MINVDVFWAGDLSIFLRIYEEVAEPSAMSSVFV